MQNDEELQREYQKKIVLVVENRKKHDKTGNPETTMGTVQAAIYILGEMEIAQATLNLIYNGELEGWLDESGLPVVCLAHGTQNANR